VLELYTGYGYEVYCGIAVVYGFIYCLEYIRWYGIG